MNHSFIYLTSEKSQAKWLGTRNRIITHCGKRVKLMGQPAVMNKKKGKGPYKVPFPSNLFVLHEYSAIFT